MKKSTSKTARSTKRSRAVATKANGGATTQAVAIIRPLTASGLRDVLWETLNDVRTNQMMPNRADAIATQAREILRTVKMQISVAATSKRKLSQDVIGFSES